MGFLLVFTLIVITGVVIFLLVDRLEGDNE